MPKLRLDIGGRGYDVHCADGEEAHLHALAVRIDAKALDAQAALGGGINEVRQLLFAALFLADEIESAAPAVPPVPAPDAAPDAAQPAHDRATVQAIDRLAARIEALAVRVAAA